VCALRQEGVVEYVVFDDEGHGFTKTNEIRGYKAILDFLDKYLRGADAASSSTINEDGGLRIVYNPPSSA
jgi:hypothetical protein